MARLGAGAYGAVEQHGMLIAVKKVGPLAPAPEACSLRGRMSLHAQHCRRCGVPHWYGSGSPPADCAGAYSGACLDHQALKARARPV